MKRLLTLILVLALPLAFTGCAEEETEGRLDPEGSQQNVDLGVLALFEQMAGMEELGDLADADFTITYDYFETAVELDPSNLEAHAGAGLTNVLRLPSHPAIGAIADSLGFGEMIAMPVLWKTSGPSGMANLVAGASRLLLGSLTGALSSQTDLDLIIDLLLGEIDNSIAHFDQVETDPDFVWLLPLPEGMGPEVLEIDVTDMYFAEAPMYWLKAGLLGLKAYDMEIDLTDEGVIEALSPGSDFLTLVDAMAMSDALSEIENGADEFQTAALSLEAEMETDTDQTDDLVRLLLPGEPPGTWIALSQDQLDTLKILPAEIDNMMATPTQVIEDFNDDEVPDTLVVTAGVLFQDPVLDWKAILPDYTIEECPDETFAIVWEATTIEEWTWHPELLNGLIALPDGPMTSDAMLEMFPTLASLFLLGGCLTP